MKPSNIALSWGLFFVSFTGLCYLIDELFYESWILEILGKENGSTEQLDRTMAYSLAVLAFAHMANIGFVLSMLKLVKNKSKISEMTFMTSSKAVRTWLLSFVPYVLFFAVFIIALDATWQREIIINKYRFFEFSTWDKIYETLTIYLPALANVLFIYLILTAINKFRAKRQKRTSELNL